MIRILLADDQRLFREGIQSLIENMMDMEVVGIAESGEDAIRITEKITPDVVLMDIHMPELDGISAAAKIKQFFPGTKVIFLTSEPDEELILRGINVGADGFLLKSLYPENLYQAIRDAVRGEIVLSGEVSRIIVKCIRELTLDNRGILLKKLENRGMHLTKRELDIAYLIMQGKTNRQIAQKYQLNEGTVKNYISEIYTKIGIRHRDKAISFLRDLLKK